MEKAWKTASTDRLRDIFCLARKNAKENSRSENVDKWKGHGPLWLSAEHWNEIIEKRWNNEGWRKKSKLGRDNRLTVKSGSITKHTAGSITIAAHKLRLVMLTYMTQFFIDFDILSMSYLTLSIMSIL